MIEKENEAQKLRELRLDFMGHYQWLASAVHSQYHKDRGHVLFTECDDSICNSVRRTLDDLNMIEKDLREISP